MNISMWAEFRQFLSDWAEDRRLMKAEKPRRSLEERRSLMILVVGLGFGAVLAITVTLLASLVSYWYGLGFFLVMGYFFVGARFQTWYDQKHGIL